MKKIPLIVFSVAGVILTYFACFLHNKTAIDCSEAALASFVFAGLSALLAFHEYLP